SVGLPLQAPAAALGAAGLPVVAAAAPPLRTSPPPIEFAAPSTSPLQAESNAMIRTASQLRDARARTRMLSDLQHWRASATVSGVPSEGNDAATPLRSRVAIQGQTLIVVPHGIAANCPARTGALPALEGPCSASASPGASGPSSGWLRSDRSALSSR